MKVGDVIAHIQSDAVAKRGIILELDPEQPDSVIWAKIMWSNGQITWEDILLSIEDDLFRFELSHANSENV